MLGELYCLQIFTTEIHVHCRIYSVDSTLPNLQEVLQKMQVEDSALRLRALFLPLAFTSNLRGFLHECSSFIFQGIAIAFALELFKDTVKAVSPRH